MMGSLHRLRDHPIIRKVNVAPVVLAVDYVLEPSGSGKRAPAARERTELPDPEEITAGHGAGAEEHIGKVPDHHRDRDDEPELDAEGDLAWAISPAGRGIADPESGGTVPFRRLVAGGLVVWGQAARPRRQTGGSFGRRSCRCQARRGSLWWTRILARRSTRRRRRRCVADTRSSPPTGLSAFATPNPPNPPNPATGREKKTSARYQAAITCLSD